MEIDNDLRLEIESLKHKINIEYNNIRSYRKIISKSEEKIKVLREKLYKKCPHNFVPDRSYNNYDRTPWICTICDESN